MKETTQAVTVKEIQTLPVHPLTAMVEAEELEATQRRVRLKAKANSKVRNKHRAKVRLKGR